MGTGEILMLNCSLQIPVNHSGKCTNLNFNFNWNGEGILGLQGTSGSGKTTLLKQIAGFGENLKGSQQQIKWNNLLWESEKYQLNACNRKVTLVFQEHPLFPHMNVQQNLEFARAHSYRQMTDEDFSNIIADFDLNDLLNQNSHHLSGGQQSRVALVQGLIAYPELLLLDEPFSALDFETRHKTAQALKHHIKKFEIAVILVSHAPQELAAICEQLLLITKHKLTGPHQEVLKVLNQQHPKDHNSSTTTTFLKAKLCRFNSTHHIAHFEVSGTEILVACKNKPEQNETIEIPASEVSLILEKPATTSIANCIEVRLESWKEMDDGCLLELKFQDQILTSKITQYSFEKLKLEKHKILFAQFKATAIDII